MPQDWLDYWAAIKKGATDQTTQDARLLSAWSALYKTNLAAIHNTDPLLVYQSVGGLAPLGGWLYGA